MRRAVQGQAPPRVLTREESEALARRVLGLVSAPKAEVELHSTAVAKSAFALGDAYQASGKETVTVMLRVRFDDGTGAGVATNRVDEAGLKALVADAEAAAREQRVTEEGGSSLFLGPQTYPEPPQLFFDDVAAAMTAGADGAAFRAATDATEGAGLIGAGDVLFELVSRAVLNRAGLWAYERRTYGEFSLTARTKNGTGSGWAWSGYEDWARVKLADVIAQAVDLGQRSANPVAVEPGRYTVILEPAAVAPLVKETADRWSARAADQGSSVFSKQPLGTNKIGLQMMDPRLQMGSDPWDPERPSPTITSYWTPIPNRVVWFADGVLRNLEYDFWYAQDRGRQPVINPGGARLFATGPTQTLEEMIASTKRGIWVHRLSHIAIMNERTLLLSGTTRDGTFLIENGKVTKAIKNFRFTESPFFVLNKLEAAGEPVRASREIVAPRLKVRDFDFTSLTDAV